MDHKDEEQTAKVNGDGNGELPTTISETHWGPEPVEKSCARRPGRLEGGQRRR